MTAPASHERVYRALLRLYPEPFRTRFGDELVQLSGDLLREARERRGGRGDVAVTWLRLLLDVALTAPAEHLDQRRVGHSLSRRPSIAMRLLGLLGVAGGLILVSAFVVFIPGTFNLGRLVLFNVGAAAIAIAVLRHAGASSARLVLTAAAVAVILANAWYTAMVVLSIGRPEYPRPDPEFRWVFLWAGVAMWWADAAFGIAVTRLRGAARWAGPALAVGSLLGFTGMGHLELANGEAGWFFGPASQVGIAMNGLGWIVLGVVVATRRRRIAGSAAAVPNG
jgi:hypothetical protein